MKEADTHAYTGVDVGGTSVDVAAADRHGKPVGPIEEMASPSTLPFLGAIEALASIVHKTREHAEQFDLRLQACGIAMPGPFDYERGISHMKHKLPSLNGKDLKTPLQEQLGVPVFFINDADAFGLGVHWNEYPAEGRLLCVTLGTGVGSAFIVDGQIQCGTNGAPEHGEVWNVPFKGGVLEDAISKQRLVLEYQQRGGSPQREVKHIVEQARAGEPAAAAAVQAYAHDLGEGLAMVSESFRPTRIVFGGRISNGLDVFAPAYEQAFSGRLGELVPYAQTQLEHPAIYGAARYAINRSTS